MDMLARSPVAKTEVDANEGTLISAADVEGVQLKLAEIQHAIDDG
jgi:hypothetical protein